MHLMHPNYSLVTTCIHILQHLRTFTYIKFEGVQMDLEDSVEIGDLVSKINFNPQHLDALFNEADKHGHRDVLEAIWVEDTSHHVHNSCKTNL